VAGGPPVVLADGPTVVLPVIFPPVILPGGAPAGLAGFSGIVALANCNGRKLVEIAAASSSILASNTIGIEYCFLI
jgi:hypothetical protein